MATGPRYRVPMRRRREVRTDYHQRLRLLKSGKPRLVARCSNKHVRAQLITPGPQGDETHAAASTEDLAATPHRNPVSWSCRHYLSPSKS